MSPEFSEKIQKEIKKTVCNQLLIDYGMISIDLVVLGDVIDTITVTPTFRPRPLQAT